MARALSADWIVTMDGPPLEGGAVIVRDDGRIDRVVTASVLPAGMEREHVAGVLVPGLVNTHTHLELTGLSVDTPPDDFAAWIRDVRERKARCDDAAFARAAREGIRRAFASGITTVADTGDSGAVLPALAAAGGSGIVYQEVFGPHPDQLAGSMAGLRARLADLRPWATGRVRLGVSPHAPYTVSGPLYREVARLARAEGLPIAVHLAESRAESAFVAGGDGPFADAWRARGIPPIDAQASGLPGAARRSPVSWLDAHDVLGPDTLCIHAVQLDAGDVALLAARGAGVAHCPRSNQRHGHGHAPLHRLLATGVRVGVGTDSELSVPGLDLFAEMRAARTLGGLDAAGALTLGTRAAARVLGLEREVGRLGAGLWADLVALDVRVSPGEPVLEAVLRAGPSDVLGTWLGGAPVYRAGRPA